MATSQTGNLNIIGDEDGSKETKPTVPEEEKDREIVFDRDDVKIIEHFFNNELNEIGCKGLITKEPRTDGPTKCLNIKYEVKKAKSVETLADGLKSNIRDLAEKEVLVPTDKKSILADFCREFKDNPDVLVLPDIASDKVRIVGLHREKVDTATHKLKIKTGVISYIRGRFNRQISDPDGSSCSYYNPSWSSTWRGSSYRSSSSEKFEFETRLKGGLVLKVYKASIIRLSVDVIVNAANDTMMHGGEVARVISEAAGYDLDKESRDYVDRQGQVKVSENIVTTAGRLPYRGVIHAVGPIWHDYGNKTDCLQDLYDCVFKILTRCEQKKFRTVGMSAISTGLFAVPKELCADMYVKAAVDFSEKLSIGEYACPEELHIIDVDESILHLVKASVEKWQRSPSSIKLDVTLEKYFKDNPHVISYPGSSYNSGIWHRGRRRRGHGTNQGDESGSYSKRNESSDDGMKGDSKVSLKSSLKKTVQGAHLPEEILKMDENAVTLYKKALEEGKEAINNIRVMIVGHCGVGKTTLTKRLFGEQVDVMKEAASTNGIDVHIKRCKVQLKDKQWLQLNKEISSEIFYNRVASVVTKFSKTEKSSDVEKNTFSYKASRHGNASTIALVKETKKKDATAVTSLPIRKDPVRNLSKQEPKQIIQKTPQTPRNIDTYKVKQTKGRSSASDKHIMEMIEDVIECSSSDNSKDIAELSIWDFAGQYVFYGTHQIFLSRRAVYLLVTDLSQHVDSVVEDECYIDAEGETQCKISDFVTFWLNSIHTFCASESSREPPVILVGTFADKLQKEKKQELVEDFFTNLRLNLVHSEAFMHLNEEIAIDNSIIDPNVELLKKKIIEVATKQSYWGELYPARWTILERALMEFKKRGVKVLEKEIFEDTNKKLPLPIETDDELELFLRFHHDAGLILYFSDGKLKNYILLQPQWLVDALKCLITAKQFCIKDRDLCKSWLKFHKTAILMKELIDAVWNSDTPFHQHKGVIIEFMEKLGIIARPQPVDESSIIEDFYIVPCVLKQSVPPKFLRYNYGDCRSTTKLCFTTPSRIIPVQVFNKLLAECVQKWPVSRERGKCLMFCGCAVFDVAELHKLYVFLKDNLIQTWINNYSHLHPEHDIDVCLNVRGFITDSLRQFVRDSRELEVYVVCPKSSYSITDSMWKVDSLTQKEEVLCEGHGCPHPIRTSKLLKHWAPRPTGQNKDLEVVPTEKQLSRMAQRIGKECRALGRELGLTRAELDHIDMDEKNRTPIDKIAAMLGQWLKRKADSATFAELKRAMIQIGMEWEHVFACL